jgi:hypothetical protein
MVTDASHLVEPVNEELLKEEDRIRVQLVESDKVLYDAELPVALINPFTSSAKTFLPNIKNLKSMSLPEFFDTTSKILSNAQQRAGVEDSKMVVLTEEYPPEPFESYGDEIIASRILRREPALMNTKGTGRPHRRSTYVDSVNSPEHPNKTIVIEARPIDHLIEFTCWGKSNKLVNARALWLERLLITYEWAYLAQGADRFFWKDRGPDTYMTSGGQRLFYRPVNFFVRFKEFEVRAHPQIKQILLEGAPEIAS